MYKAFTYYVEYLGPARQREAKQFCERRILKICFPIDMIHNGILRFAGSLVIEKFKTSSPILGLNSDCRMSLHCLLFFPQFREVT